MGRSRKWEAATLAPPAKQCLESLFAVSLPFPPQRSAAGLSPLAREQNANRFAATSRHGERKHLLYLWICPLKTAHGNQE